MNSLKDKIEEVRKLGSAIEEFLSQPDDAADIACTKSLEKAIESVLKDHGVKPELDENDTQIAMLENALEIYELEFEGAPQVAGIYIFKAKEPIAYISYPYLNKEAQVVTRIERFDRDIEVRPSGIILPKGMIKGISVFVFFIVTHSQVVFIL